MHACSIAKDQKTDPLMLGLLHDHLLVDARKGFSHILQLLIAVPDVALPLGVIGQRLGQGIPTLWHLSTPVMHACSVGNPATVASTYRLEFAGTHDPEVLFDASATFIALVGHQWWHVAVSIMHCILSNGL